MKRSIIYFMVGLAVFGTYGCSKDGSSNTTSKNAKFTFKVTGLNVAEGDEMHMIIAGTDASATMTWKVNGQERANEAAITITKNDLAGGNTIVVESTRPVLAASVSITGYNMGAPFTVAYTAEVAGSKKNDLDDQVTESYNKAFQY